MKSSKHRPTEADFEAAISAVLQQAFPALSTNNIQHQLTFRIRIGRTMHNIKSTADDWAAGRCDLLITKDGAHLAILELKRPGIELTEDDRGQGLSYARLMEPWPPLVIVSNESETRIYETFSGKEWTPQNRDETALSHLFTSSATLARSDLTNAVETLLGSSNKCWTPLVRSFSQEQIDRLTGEWGDLEILFSLTNSKLIEQTNCLTLYMSRCRPVGIVPRRIGVNRGETHAVINERFEMTNSTRWRSQLRSELRIRNRIRCGCHHRTEG